PLPSDRARRDRQERRERLQWSWPDAKRVIPPYPLLRFLFAKPNTSICGPQVAFGQSSNSVFIGLLVHLADDNSASRRSCSSHRVSIKPSRKNKLDLVSRLR